MNNSLRDGAAWLAVLVFAGVVGCGPKRPAVEPVEGKILLDGQPLAEATVGFSPAGGGGLPAAGLTAADGTFRLNAVHGAKAGGGTAVGEYVVTVAKRVTEGSDGPTSTDDPNYGKSAATLVEPKVKNLVPDLYGDPKTSPLRASVAAGKNTFEFKLDSKAAAAKKK